MTTLANALRPDELARLVRDTDHFITQDQISYGHHDPDRPPPRWSFDPIPWQIPGSTWDRLAEGLEQRGRMLNALLADLASEMTVIREGIVPASLILRHKGFLAPVLDLGTSLTLLAIDVIETTTGAWVPIHDAVQAPSGAGYALANRRLSARLLGKYYRDAQVSRIRGFFDHTRTAFQSAAHPGVLNPNVVLLGGGQGSETAFDQALLASVIGAPLAHGDDLHVHNGKLWMESTHGSHVVDVLHRRIDPEWSDALDLRGDSTLGAAGLAAAVRRQTVSVVNPLNAAMIENPGFAAFERELFAHLLGEQPLLSSPPTYWCGDETHRNHVLGHLDSLVIKPVSRGTGPATYRGWELSPERRAYFVDQISRSPWAWVAREPVDAKKQSVASSPGQMDRRASLRTFAVNHDGTLRFMPGGLARVAADRDQVDVRSAAGATSKDVWVTGQTEASFVVAGSRTGFVARPHLSHHGAENMFWFGRYAERGESTARLVSVTDSLIQDHEGRESSPGHSAMTTMVRALAGMTGQESGDLNALVFAHEEEGTVAYALERAHIAALSNRELLSKEVFSVLARLESTFETLKNDGADASRVDACVRVIEAGLALAGLAHESIVRDPVWSFLEAGRRIERAIETTRLLAAAIEVDASPVAEELIASALLTCCDSSITYQRRMALGSLPPNPFAATVELLVADLTNPRSVAWQVARLGEALETDDELSSQIAPLESLIAGVDVEGPVSDVVATLREMGERLAAISDSIETAYFRSEHKAQRMAGWGWETHQ